MLELSQRLDLIVFPEPFTNENRTGKIADSDTSSQPSTTTLQLAVILVGIVVALMLFPVVLLAVERIRRRR